MSSLDLFVDLNQREESKLPAEFLQTWTSGFHPRNCDIVGLELTRGSALKIEFPLVILMHNPVRNHRTLLVQVHHS